jgi:hypothetical protein
MKKWLVFLMVLAFGAFATGAALAAQYDMTVLGGSIWAAPGGVSGLPGTPPTTPVEPLDPTRDPFVTGPLIGPMTPVPSGTWNGAGWWEFAVTGSTGSDWNDVFAGGDWFFEMIWKGVVEAPESPLEMPPAVFDTTNSFENVYGKWYENNSSVWTYFGLYVPPNSGPASIPATPPIGVFAFVAADPGGNYDWDLLYKLSDGEPVRVIEGAGIVSAVPEPSTMLLLGAGLLGLVGFGRRRLFQK